MHRYLAALTVLLMGLTFAGCTEAKKDAVTGADQSAIDAYLATEASEQKALEGQMKDSVNNTK